MFGDYTFGESYFGEGPGATEGAAFIFSRFTLVVRAENRGMVVDREPRTLIINPDPRRNSLEP